MLDAARRGCAESRRPTQSNECDSDAREGNHLPFDTGVERNLS